VDLKSMTDDRDPVERLAEELVERRRRGEKPTVQEYEHQYPELAEQIRDLFPAILMMEDLRPSREMDEFSLGKADSADMPETLGDYRLLREVGRGGMGVVYEAEQASLGRHVAVKVLRTGPLLSVKYRQRFEHEARSAGRLHHTNIVPVFGVGHQDGQCYYVMQYIQGQGLDAVIDELKRLKHFSSASNRAAQRVAPSARLATTPLSSSRHSSEPKTSDGSVTSNVSDVPPQTSSASHSLVSRKIVYPASVARIGAQAAQALDYAHSQGIVHRDIKPSNLLLDMKGDVWVTDFGLAKASDADDLTGTGDFVGTLRYMAPERFRGQADGRSDVYGLGLTLYELLVGRPAYDESDRNALIHQVTQREPPDLRSLDPYLPRDLCTIVRKAIARDPSDRYQTGGEMAGDLQRFLEDRPIRARRTSLLERSRRWCQRNPTVATLAASLAFVLITGLVVVSRLWWDADTARRDEEWQRKRAVLAQKERETEAARANALAEDNHRQLVRMSVANGARSWDAGDRWNGLLWYAEALRLDRGNPQHEGVHRARLKNFSEQAPRLTKAWHVPGGVGAAEFSPDGKLIVAAGYLRWGPGSEQPVAERTGAAHLWNAETGERVCPPLQHGGLVRHAGFSRDSRRIVTACDDGAARVWDARTGALTAGPFRHSEHRVRHAAFSPDGQRIATACDDNAAHVWDIERGTEAFRPLLNPDPVHHVEFSPDGEYLATATYSSQVTVWNAQDGSIAFAKVKGGVRAWFAPDSRRLLTGFNARQAELWELSPGKEKLTSLFKFLPNLGCRHATFSPDGQRVAVCYVGSGVQIWDVKSERPLTAILSVGNWVWNAAFSPDGRTLATAGDDRVVRFWDAFTGRSVRSALPHASTILSVAFHPNGRELLTSTDNGMVLVWDLQAEPQPDLEFAQQGHGHDLAFNGNGSLASATGNTVRVWDTASGKACGEPIEHPVNATAVIFDGSGEKLVTGDASGAVRIWNVKSGKLLDAPLEQPGAVMRIERSDAMRRLLVVTTDNNDSATRATVWDVEKRRKIWTMHKPSGTFATSLSGDGRKIAVGSVFEAQIWDVESNRAITPAMKHRGEIWRVGFNKDATRIVTACSDSTLNGMYAQMWDAATGEAVGPNLMHSDGVLVAAFSRDGKRIVSGGDDKIARVWDAESGKPITPALRHGGVVLDASFSPDGQFILCRTDSTAHVWDAETGHPVAYISPNASGGQVIQARFRLDSQAFVTTAPDGIARLWPLRPNRKSVDEWVRFVQLHAGHRIDATGGFAPLTGGESESRWMDAKP
jgi:WD40 repeat protein/serine/threonine protein kinase